jgi:phosphatidylinositol-3-phosphatase
MRDQQKAIVRRRLEGGPRWFVAAALAAMALLPALSPSGAAGAGSGLPRIRHVWVVMLENQGVGAWTSDTGLSALVGRGAFIKNYFGIAHQSLPNYLGMISGQGPTPETQADCQTYRDLSPSAPGQPDTTTDYQAQGNGCVYAPKFLTLVDQLAALGYRWKGYMEDLNFAPEDGNVTCKPTAAQGAGTQDPTQSGRPNDQYALRHDPFMYFHSIIDNPGQCNNVVTLQSEANGLRHDLLDIGSTPNYSLVVPNLCNDGHDGAPKGCAGPDAKNTSNSGLAAVDDWLSIYIPMILASPAYQQDGALVVTFDEGPTQDGASCCNQRGYPNTPAGEGGPPNASGGGYGGGQVGAVVLSPFIKPGTATPNSYNHFSLLRTLEDMFHTVGGDDKNGHLGYATNDDGQSVHRNPGEFAADVFTNPGYVPPPPPEPGVFTLPPVVVPYAPSPSAPPALRQAITMVAATPVQIVAPATPAPDTPTPSPTPAHWDRSMLTSLPGDAGNAGLIAGFVLAPLLATGGVTLFLRRRGSG